jgi:hypothetical protein
MGARTNSQISINIPGSQDGLKDQKQSWTTMTPQQISTWIDKRSRFIFPLAFLIFNIFYWTFVTTIWKIHQSWTRFSIFFAIFMNKENIWFDYSLIKTDLQLKVFHYFILNLFKTYSYFLLLRILCQIFYKESKKLFIAFYSLKKVKFVECWSFYNTIIINL